MDQNYENPNPNQNPNQPPYQNQPPQWQGGYQPPYQPEYNPYDHTAEFEPRDISQNKVICMLCYLLGTVGVIMALLASSNSPYTAFHVRQALKFTVVTVLVGILSALLCWTILVPIAGGIFLVVLYVVKIVCFFQICQGKAVEPVIIRSLGFLR
ncbi:MAG: zinc ribbon domain-containing protein [Firmicutes bacterium]|nr:zinc ribbon domain-containing protein [Bacillota bacterium]